jgi:hypothetical protein
LAGRHAATLNSGCWRLWPILSGQGSQARAFARALGSDDRAHRNPAQRKTPGSCLPGVRQIAIVVEDDDQKFR